MPRPKKAVRETAAKYKTRNANARTETYSHPDSKSPLRPDVGLQTQFKQKKTPAKFQYDPYLDPQLVWAGKAERTSFEVPTLPLFVHERLSTQAILETLKGHKRDKRLDFFDQLFGEPQLSISDRLLKAYEYQDNWRNRLILGDSLVVMNSLLGYEGLGGQVQMIYVDPPYGVKFGSNFQPFVRKRDVKHNADDDLTREPEMVQAYRDTWELGIHSYLTYLRDRFLLARELLAPSGSIFVQISDENVHHVKEVLDEVFGAENYLNVVPFVKTTGITTKFLARNVDFLLWYARNREHAKYRTLFLPKTYEAGTAENYNWIELPDGTRRGLTTTERRERSLIPSDGRIYKPDNIATQGNPVFEFEFRGKVYRQPWKTSPSGMKQLADANRLHVAENSLQYVRYITDFPCVPVTQLWDDTGTGSFTDEKIYAVQTGVKVLERCLLMTTDPGDLVLDPTCGSGTTAYVAEQWGRRWITIDTSRVPLALARQRLLTATFSYYELKDEARGPAGGFVYKRKQNKRGEEVGGIVPHVTLKSIANDEPPDEEVLVDRPEVTSSITRVCGPFTVEATIPTPMAETDAGRPTLDDGGYPARMLEALRRVATLRLPDNRAVTIKNVRSPAKTLSLSAEAIVANGKDSPVAFVFGPENGAVTETLVFQAAREAYAKSYSHLYVLGFAIQPNARQLIENCETAVGVPASYVQATPDLMMGDLLKNLRSSQIFSVVGAPEIKLTRLKRKSDDRATLYQAELLGLDVFDPIKLESDHRRGDDVPAWLLDADYNDLCFHVSQAFFPRTAAWENLKRALKGAYEDSVWEHLAGTVSEPFTAGEREQIAVKVIDDRGNELLVVRKLSEAEREK